MPSFSFELINDRYWGSMLHIFQHHGKLQRYLTTKYIDIEAHEVRIQLLRRESRPWSDSEKFMLNLALHCFNSHNKVNLGDMDYLDDYNRKLAFEALRIRYGGR